MTAKDIVLRSIPSKEATELIKRIHYSGKVCQNSQLHIGVFYHGKLEGAMQFGPSIDKRKTQGLVTGTGWNEFIELNRMAFTDVLPRNSESRAISIALKILKKKAPHLKWVISFADACQCGDGTIYRASGFVLTGIKINKNIYKLPLSNELNANHLLSKGLSDSDITIVQNWIDSITPCVENNKNNPCVHKLALEKGGDKYINEQSSLLSQVINIMRKSTKGAASANGFFRLIGGVPAIGHQLRYIYFLDSTSRQNLTVSEIPFNRIKELGTNMYKGLKTN